MQKFIKLLMVLSCLLCAQSAWSANVSKEMNIYATVLSVKTQMTNTSRQATVKFLLSSPAKGVWIYIDSDKDGDFADEIAVFSDANLVLRRDAYAEITFAVDDNFAGGDYDWAVKVKGAPEGTDYDGRTNINGGKSFGFNDSWTNKAKLVRDYTNPDHRYKFAKPKGLAVNTNFNSKYCGFIYVGEAGALSGLKKYSKRPIRLGSSQGLYAFKPNTGTIWSNKKDALLNKSPYGTFAGDVTWYKGEEQYNGPSHVSVVDDDYVYISQNHPTSINGKEFEERIWRVKASDLKDNNKNAEFKCILTTTMLDKQTVGNDKLYRRVLAMSVGKIGNRKLLYVISGYSEKTLLTYAALSSWEIKEKNDGTCSLTFIKSMNLKSIPYGSNTKQDLMSQYCSVVPGNDNGDLWIFQRVTEGENNTFAAIHLSPTNTAWTLDYRIGSENYYNITGTGAVSKHHTLGNSNDYYLVFPGYTEKNPTPSIKVFRMFINENNLKREFQFSINNPEDIDGELGGFASADGVAIDAVNNIFFGSSITKKVYVYALPKENEHTTPSNSEAQLQVPYTVNWVDAESGTVISGKKHKYMFSTDKLPVLSKENLIFQGWYTNASFTGSPVSNVTSNCTLYAKWIDAYKGVGVFSVSDTEVITFAPGNLQYTQSTKKWQFASAQYEMMGTNNVTGGTAGTQGNGEYRVGTALADKIDLFGWGTGNAPTKTSENADDYTTFVDWGTNVIGNDTANTWQTLTHQKWDFLINKRAEASDKTGIAQVDGVNGIILLPDNWVCPAGITFKAGFQQYLGMNFYRSKQTFTAEQWKKLEDAGAVFLPAAAYRNGYTITSAQYQGYYWASTKNTETGGLYYYYFVSKEAGVSSQGDKFTGRSVRLAKDYTPITVDSTTTKVTSSYNQTVKQLVRITIADKVGISTITGTSDNPAFTVTSLSNVGPGEHYLVINYTPTTNTDGIETATITLHCSNIYAAAAIFPMTGRHLPENFVIAAKQGNEWVALTANIADSYIQPAQPIVVDNTTTPTKATVALNTCLYQLRGLTGERYTANGTAAHFYSTQTQKVLKASTDSNTKTYLATDATHADAQNSANRLFYEWQLVSEDLVHYTLTNSNQTTSWENNRILGYSTELGMWGMYAVDTTVNQDVLLLPVEIPLTDKTEVMEWSTNNMVLRTESTNPTQINISLAGKTSCKTLTPIENSDLYQVSDIDLTGNDCETMAIWDDSNNGTIVRKPILVSENAESSNYVSDVCHQCDVVVLGGAELSAGEEYTDFANLYVYPGGHLVLDNQSMGVKQQVYLRGGYSWLNQTDNDYALPEVYLDGTINFTGSKNIIYDYYIKNYQYFQFALPYTVPLSKVTDEAGEDDFPVWVKHYNGALRAADPYATSWEWYNGNDFERGIGYVIAAKPRQVGNTANRPLSIIRFPLGNEELNTSNIEPNLEDLPTKAHGIEGYNAGTVTANNVGWHLLGNPFMSTWKGDIGHHLLEQNIVDDKWDGSYNWVEENVKYITIMSAVSGTDYDQYVAANTELKPFFPFFMQEASAGGSGFIDFARDNRIQKENAPARLLEKAVREVFVQVEIATNQVDDQTGLFISDTYADDIDLDDYEKMFGSSTDKAKLWLVHGDKRMAFEAMTETAAAANIALGYRAPKAGNYTFAINEDLSALNDVIAVYLTDHEKGITDYDLLSNAYTFESQAANYNDQRFTIRIELHDYPDGVETGVNNLGIKHGDTYKFIHRDKIYIYHGGVIYDATGKQVTNINK